MEYISERKGLACTVFVPFICGNNCEFCNTRSMYDGFHYNDEYLQKILNQIDKCNQSTMVDAFILTGGEPFINLDLLKIIMGRMQKPVSINTTLPYTNNINDVINYINTYKNIKYLSISRQLNMDYNVAVCDNTYLARIHKPIKINAMLTEDMLDDASIDAFINQYKNYCFRMNFRGDYTKTTDTNLKNIDTVSRYFFNRFEYVGSAGCLICYTQQFKTDDDFVITYHRGVPRYSLMFDGRCYISDIIVDMFGNMYKDWDFIEDPTFNEWFLSTIPKVDN